MITDPGPRAAVAIAVALLFAACADGTAPSEPSLGRPQLGLVAGPPPLCAPTTGVVSVPLIADETQTIGTVAVGNTETHLYVTYATSSAWPLARTALFVGEDAASIPTSGGGNPRIGHFPYGATHPAGTTEVTWEVSLAGLDAAVVVLATFAEVLDEGAWAGDLRINPRAGWATYFEFAIASCEPETVEEIIDNEVGGEVLFGDIVTLEIDAGSLDQAEVTISITPSSSDNPDVVPGTVFLFGPAGTQFDPPARLTIQYDPAVLGSLDESQLCLVYIENGDVTPVEACEVNTTLHQVSGLVSHFSTLGIAAVPPAAPTYFVFVVGDPSMASSVNPVTNTWAISGTSQNQDGPFAMVEVPTTPPSTPQFLVTNRGNGTLVRCFVAINPNTGEANPGCVDVVMTDLGDPIALALWQMAPLVVDHGGAQVLTNHPLVSAPIAVSAAPRGITVLPDGSRAYVAADGVVDVIDLSPSLTQFTVIATIPIGSAGQNIVASPDGSYVYVTASPDPDDPNPDFAGVGLYRINTTTNAVDGAVLDVGEMPYGLAIDAAGATGYGSDLAQLHVIDLTTWTVSSSIDADGIRSIALSPDGASLWMIGFGFGQLERMDVNTHNVTAIPAAGAFVESPAGLLPMNVPQ